MSKKHVIHPTDNIHTTKEFLYNQFEHWNRYKRNKDSPFFLYIGFMSDIADFVDIPSAEYSALKERIALLERENADLKRENADLKHTLDTVQHKLDAVQHKLDAVQHKLDAVQHKLDVSCHIS